jgi:type IV pilus assembly protein PilC
VVIFLLSFVTVGILSGFVLPRFKTFFLSLHAKLPLPTRMLLSFTGFITTWWPVLLGVLGAMVLSILLGLRTHKGREIKDKFVLRVPVLGPVVRFAIVERFCRVLSSMVETGVPLPEALRLGSIGTHNLVYERGLAEAQVGMLQGGGISRPIGLTGLFPRAVVQMMRVGEDTGTLDEQLDGMANYYERELDYKLKKLTTIFEPIAIIFMGLVVGFVAIALVSAMYGIFNQVKIQ